MSTVFLRAFAFCGKNEPRVNAPVPSIKARYPLKTLRGTATQSFRAAEFLILEENLSVNFSLGCSVADLKLFEFCWIFCTFIFLC